ncbi:M20/M25/M40 family metallo-hydrolase [Candidatus Chlorohelix sp.]|uniref:M20/M25/M40 family metallo-hydrolase n=1 Tax=Candidatus Chlorohelix sp. TaxID=3139201 RepID=UPI00302EEEF6
MINEARLKEHFLDLITTDSHSRKEREVALKLKAVMEELGASVEIDAAGEFAGGNTGNVICRLAANNPAAPAFFLAAHMDTVVPGEGVKPVIEGNIIRTDGTTILGGDDKSGCAIIVEVIRTLVEKNIPHGEIEAVFTICEEVGLLGAKFLDATRLNSKYGIVLDSDDVGYLFIKAPASAHMEWTINGVAAHAGMAPEKGISTIKIAGEALANMKLGKIDRETTANIGFIQGGGPTNIIPNKTVLHGEARSLNEAKLDEQVAHMDECFKAAAARYQVEVDGKLLNASVESHIERSYDSMNLSEDSPIVQLVIRAARNLEYQVQPMEMMGGCDANIFNKKGLSCANLGTGMRSIHTVNEWLDVRDLYRAASIVLEITRLNGQLTVA